MNKLLVGVLALLSVPALAQDRVSKFDKNNDNRVDYTELSSVCNISKQLFDKADKDSDGFLTNSEMRTAKSYLFRNCGK